MPGQVERHVDRPGRRSSKESRPARLQGAPAPDGAVLRLQARIGNAAVSRLLWRSPRTDSNQRDVGADAKPPSAERDIVGAARSEAQGAADYRAGRFEEARAAFAEAYRLDPHAFYLYDQADALEHLGRPAEAAELYERYLAEAPYASDSAKVKSRIRKLRGEVIPEGEDDDEPAITGKGEAGAREWFARAQSAYVAGRYAKAAEGFRRAFELEPLAGFIYDEGAALDLGGHPRAASNAFEYYLILDPSAKDAAEVIARIKALRGQTPPDGKDALMDPEDEQSAAPAVTSTGVQGASEWFNRGQVAYNLGDYKRAYDCFVQAYDLKPFPGLVYNQAASLERLGNTDAAVQAYERYLALDPNAADAPKVRKHIKRLQGTDPTAPR